MIYSTSCWCREVELDETIVMGPRGRDLLATCRLYAIFQKKKLYKCCSLPSQRTAQRSRSEGIVRRKKMHLVRARSGVTRNDSSQLVCVSRSCKKKRENEVRLSQ